MNNLVSTNFRVIMMAFVAVLYKSSVNLKLQYADTQ